MEETVTFIRNGTNLILKPKHNKIINSEKCLIDAYSVGIDNNKLFLFDNVIYTFPDNKEIYIMQNVNSLYLFHHYQFVESVDIGGQLLPYKSVLVEKSLDELKHIHRFFIRMD